MSQEAIDTMQQSKNKKTDDKFTGPVMADINYAGDTLGSRTLVIAS